MLSKNLFAALKVSNANNTLAGQKNNWGILKIFLPNAYTKNKGYKNAFKDLA